MPNDPNRGEPGRGRGGKGKNEDFSGSSRISSKRKKVLYHRSDSEDVAEQSTSRSANQGSATSSTSDILSSEISSSREADFADYSPGEPSLSSQSTTTAESTTSSPFVMSTNSPSRSIGQSFFENPATSAAALAATTITSSISHRLTWAHAFRSVPNLKKDFKPTSTASSPLPAAAPGVSFARSPTLISRPGYLTARPQFVGSTSPSPELPTLAGQSSNLECSLQSRRAPYPTLSTTSGGAHYEQSSQSGYSHSTMEIFKLCDKESTSKAVAEHVASSSFPASGQNASCGIVTKTFKLDEMLKEKLFSGHPLNIINKLGTNGTPVDLVANYFPLKMKPDSIVYRYSFSIEPDPKERRLCVLNKYFEKDGFMDIGNFVYSMKSCKNGTIPFSLNHLGTFNITINQSPMSKEEQVRALDKIVLHMLGKCGFTRKGRSIFDNKERKEMASFKMDLLPVFIVVLREHKYGLLLRCEFAHKVMQTATVYDIIATSLANSNFQESLRKYICGKTVITGYSLQNYRIFDVNFNMTPRSSFIKQGHSVPFTSYFFRIYSEKIRDEGQPMLVSKTRSDGENDPNVDRILLVPEMCHLIDVENERDQEIFKRHVSQETRLSPTERVERLGKFYEIIQEKCEELRKWNFTLADLVSVRGRVLKEEEIIIGNLKHIGADADWSSAFNRRVFRSIPIKLLSNWFVIHPRTSKEMSERFVRILFSKAALLGYTLQRPMNYFEADQTSQYLHWIHQIRKNPNAQFILIVLRDGSGQRYSEIKKAACITSPILTQVLLLKSIHSPKVNNVASKTCLQISTKFGNPAWVMNVQLPGLMVISYDFAKDTLDPTRSFGACVTAMELFNRCRFHSEVRACNDDDDLNNKIWPFVENALQAHYKFHNYLPKYIILYRDSIGSGSRNDMYDKEVSLIVKKLCQCYGIEFMATFAYIVVSKSSNTRLFKQCYDIKGQNLRSNPKPGTVVDNVITLPGQYDFFLASQNVRCGSLTPTYYNIIYSTLPFTPDEIQRITFQLTHLYFNWTGTIRVPAVCQYAKKLAVFVCTHLHEIPNTSLQETFFYL